MGIKAFVFKHKKINYIQRCIRRMKDEAFVEDVLSIGKNPLDIKIRKHGDKNFGKTIYIAQTMGCDGFFAELRFIVSELYFADSLGFEPVVKMPKESFYAEKEPVNGTTNPFEYYFEPVSNISLEDAEQSNAVVEHNWYQRNYINDLYGMSSGYLPSEEYIRETARIVKKYIHLNEQVSELIKNDISQLLGDKKTLCVHVRGADFKRHYKNHPNIVLVDEYVEIVKNVLQEQDFEQIFLATDDLSAIEAFEENFGDKVVYYSDVIRTKDDETVMKSQVDRELHHYKLGLEVIRDAYTLAACDGLIAGLSNVSIFANIIKMSEGKSYCYQQYINKGIK